MALTPVRRWVVWIKLHRDNERWMYRILARQTPNMITLIRAIVALPLALAFRDSLRYLAAQPTAMNMLVAAGWLFAILIILAMDALDGTLATMGQVTSNFGRLIDPLSDKWVVMITYYGLWLAGSTTAADGWLQLVTGLVVVDIVTNSNLAAVGFARALQLSYRIVYRPPQAETWGKRKAVAQFAALMSWGIATIMRAIDHKTLGDIWLIVCFLSLVLAIFCGLASLKRHWQQLTGGVYSRSQVARWSAVWALVATVLIGQFGWHNSFLLPPVWLIIALVIGGIQFAVVHTIFDHRLIRLATHEVGVGRE